MVRGWITAVFVTFFAMAASAQVQPLQPFGEPVQFDPVTGQPIAPNGVQQPPAPVVTIPPVTGGQPFTLEDLRRELTFIAEQIDVLRRLGMPSAASLPSDIQGPSRGDVLTRINDLEGRLAWVQSELDTLRFDMDRIAEDGGRRLSDMDFRVTLLEQSDPAFVPPPTSFGAGVTDPAAPVASPFGASEIALAEQFAFDAAMTALQEQNLERAAQQFEAFLEVYPDGPLSAEARLRQVDVVLQQGQYGVAAGRYLAIFNQSPDGPFAPQAMLGLGASLARLGQTREACLTFSEAFSRYASRGQTDFIQQLQAEFQRFNCQ